MFSHGFHSSLLLALVSTLTDHLLLNQPSPRDANSSAAHVLQAPSSQALASLTLTGHYLSMTYYCGQELHALTGQAGLGLRSSRVGRSQVPGIRSRKDRGARQCSTKRGLSPLAKAEDLEGRSCSCPCWVRWKGRC